MGHYEHHLQQAVNGISEHPGSQPFSPLHEEQEWYSDMATVTSLVK